MSGARVGASPFREFNANRRRGAAMFSPPSRCWSAGLRFPARTNTPMLWAPKLSALVPNCRLYRTPARCAFRCRSSWHPSKEAYRLGEHTDKDVQPIRTLAHGSSIVLDGLVTRGPSRSLSPVRAQ